MKTTERWRRTTIANKAMVVSTALIALGTLFLAIAAIFQYLSTREQGKIARQSMIANNRPYVTASIIEEQQRLEVGQPVRLRLEFVNDGISPAQEFTFKGQFVFAPLLRPPTAFIDAKQGELGLRFFLIPTTIAPQKEKAQIHAESGAALTVEDVKAIEGEETPDAFNTHRDKQLVLYGEISYKGMGENFIDKLCFRYTFNRITKEGSWANCFTIPTMQEN